MVAILILNWNGYKDTIECLKSLYKMDYNDFFIVVGDNGSKDGSLSEIKKWCDKNNINYKSKSLEDKYIENISTKELVLYDLKENHGFSIGNNLMIKFLSNLKPDYYFLLNNDTEVLPDTMSTLIDFASNNNDISVLTPQIRYFYCQTKVWNCGGSIKWGIRKYHYGNESYLKIKETLYKPCTFITGCALLFKKDVLKDNGSLFTEKYFFGEEDFELCLRLRKNAMKMGCVIPAIIYHKVGTSTKNAKSIKRAFIYYMNRFIDMRDYMGCMEYFIWKTLYLPYVFRLILKETKSWSYSLRFIRTLLSELRNNNGVSRDFFEQVWNTDKII